MTRISGETRLAACVPAISSRLYDLSMSKPRFFSNYEFGPFFSQLAAVSRYLGAGVEVSIDQKAISTRTPSSESIHMLDMTHCRSRCRASCPTTNIQLF